MRAVLSLLSVPWRRARRAIRAIIDSMRGDENLVFLEFPNQARLLC